MPVRYDIAAGIPQQQGGLDPLNAFATMQAMSYRQQQNALAQMQMQEYQRKLQDEQALRGLAPNFQDPRFAEQVFRYNPEFARQLYGSQLAGERERRMAEQAAAATDETRRRAAVMERKYTEIELPKSQLEAERERRMAEQAAAAADASRRRAALDERKYEELELPKFGLEKQKLGAEITREERAGKKLDFEINKEALDRDAKTLERLENFGAKVFNTNGKGYDQFRQMAIKEHPEFENMLPATYDADTLSGFIDNAANTREKLKSASEYEYREITDATGATRVVAIPKRSPRAGAIEIPGTAGAKPADYGFMPTPAAPEYVTRTNSRTGATELVLPAQPNAMAVPPTAQPNAMAAPPTAAPAVPPTAPAPAPAAPGRLIPSEIRPTTEAPVGSVAYNNKRFATEVLDAAGFNAETGEDEVSKLIRGSTSGGMEAGAAGVGGFFGYASKGMKNIAKLETIKNDVVLKKLSGKLGQGISEGDRQFVEKLVGDIANPNIPAGQRLAAWDQIKGLMVKYANAGQPAAAAAGAPANRPSLDEIFK